MRYWLWLMRFPYRKCLVLLAVYMLGMIIGSTIILSFDFKGYMLEPVRNARDLSSHHDDHLNVNRLPLHRTQKKKIKTTNSLKIGGSIDDVLERTLLFSAVLPSNFSNIDKIASLYNTWGEIVTNMAIFLPLTITQSEFFEDTTFVRELKINTTKYNYPTTESIYQVLRYLYKHYAYQFRYFLISSDNLYVNKYNFLDLVSNVSEHSIIYTGHPIKYGRTTYCLGDGGILLSQVTLLKLVPKLRRCEKWHSTYSWDKTLGRCVKKILNQMCTNISTDLYFKEDREMQSLSPDNLWQSDSPFSNIFTVFPVANEEHMNTLHYFYTSLEMKRFEVKEDYLRQTILRSCETLADYAFEHQVVKRDCEAIAKDSDSSTIIPFPLALKEKKRKKRLKYRPLRWKFFDDRFIYSEDTTIPSISYNEDKQMALRINDIVQSAETIVQERYHSPNLKLQHMTSGYIKLDIFRGNEYIVDGLFNDSVQSVNERIHLFQPLATGMVLQLSKNTLSEKVHILVPISNVNQKYQHFLDLYIKSFVESEQSTHLVLVVYKKNDYDTISKKINDIKQQYPTADISMVRGRGRFSRSKALHQGIATLKHSDLVFFCDVDMVIDPSFLDRCRLNTVRGETVYFPVIIKLYNPKFVNMEENYVSITRRKGHWANYGYGMVCIYKSDYIHVGGLNIRLRGWGGEDEDFYHRVLRKGLSVFRAPDTGLVHNWHPRVCSPKTVRRSMQSSCISSKLEALGSRRELARFIFNFTEKHPDLL